MPLDKNAPTKTWIDDFIASDAPQFKGKSKAKRIKMAVAAKLAAQKEEFDLDAWLNEQIDESYTMTQGTDKRGKTATQVGATLVDGKKGANIMKHHETGKYFAAPGANTGFVKGKTQLHDTAKAAADAYHGVNESYELKEAVDPIHAKLKALGYKKNSSESTPGLNKTWYKHPSGKHPLSTEDLAKHLGHSESDAWKKKYPGEYEGEFGSNDTHDANTGTRTSKQGGGTLFVGIPKNKKAKSDNLQGRDNDARYESVELEENKYTSKSDSSDELDARPGAWRGEKDMSKRLKKDGTPTKHEKGMQDNLKARIKMTAKMGGLTGPKGNLPEGVEMNEEFYKFKQPISVRSKHGTQMMIHGYDGYRDVFKGNTDPKYAGNHTDIYSHNIHQDDHHKVPSSIKDIKKLSEGYDLEEALEGSTCKRCDGAGKVRRSVGLKKETCPHCGGTGIDSSKDSVTPYHPKAKSHQAWLKSMKNEEVELEEAKMRGNIIPPSSPRHPLHAEWKAAQPKKERKPRAPTVRRAKEIDTSDPKLHKALEKHFGGSFEHFESEPRHGHNEHGHATMTARVTHSYTHKDLGMRPDDMEDTAETHRVKVTKHPEHGYKVSLGESVDPIKSLAYSKLTEKFDATVEDIMEAVRASTGIVKRVLEPEDYEAKEIPAKNRISDSLPHPETKKKRSVVLRSHNIDFDDPEDGEYLDTHGHHFTIGDSGVKLIGKKVKGIYKLNK